MLLQAIKEREKGQVRLKSPHLLLLSLRDGGETDFLHPHPKHHAKNGIREGNTNRHFQNVMWLKAPWVKRQIS